MVSTQYIFSIIFVRTGSGKMGWGLGLGWDGIGHWGRRPAGGGGRT